MKTTADAAILFFVLMLTLGEANRAVADDAAWSLDKSDWHGSTVKGEDGSGPDIGSIEYPAAFSDTQRVYLDFDTGTAGFDHVYTESQRDTITALVAADYAPWDFTFSHTAVPTAPFALLTFNSGPAGGLASDIDFRNLDLGGSATIDVNPLLGGLGPPQTVPNVIGLSATIAAHELGHLVGARHADSLGPIGGGLAPTGPAAGLYSPTYPGPTVAGESTVHTMASPLSVGQSLSTAIGDTYHGERSAVKLEFTETGTVSPEVGVPHGLPAAAQLLTLPTIGVPNTLMPGDAYFGLDLFADAETVTAAITAPGETDYYSFTGSAGDIFNVEVISIVPDRISPKLNPEVTMYLTDGTTPVPQGTGSAFNDDEFEFLDSALIDVVLPSAGTYYVRVNASGLVPTDTGDYELFIYRFRAEVPEPSTLVLAVMGLAVMLATRRRK